MKKIISAVLATIMVASTAMFVLAADITAKLVSVEDFESCAVGTYTEGKIVDLGPKLGYVNVAGGSVLEICQEADGNKYLKATIPEYAAIGYYFGAGSSRKYAYMTFDYKFPTAGGNANFASYAHTGATSGNASYLNGKDSWFVSSPSTDTNATEWTQAKEKNYTNAYSACMGIASSQGGGNRVIYLDNIIVWEFNDTVGATHNSSAPATVTFANPTGHEASATMPNPYSGIAWCNLYNAQSSNCTINLNNYEPSNIASGKQFLGWSLTDGGNVIKPTMYAAFKIPGSITLYAVWEETQVPVKKPASLVSVEDFEACAVGTYTGGKIVDLGPKLGYVNVAAGSVLEVCREADGNKYLKATVPEYAAFGYYFGTGADRKYAYMTFDYKFPTAEGNANFASYGHTGATSGNASFLNGTDSWGISSPSTTPTATEWTQAKEKNYTNAYSACMGIAPVQGGGNRVIYVDNIIVWEFDKPVGETHNSSISATVTFANSTGYEGTATMPEPYVGIAWCNLYNAQSSNCTINLNNYIPTGTPSGKLFAGWALTDGGNVIKSTMYSAFKIPGDITLYAVWKDKPAPAATLVKVEDFEAYEVGTYTGEELVDLGAKLGRVNIKEGAKLEICQEEDGNKYLKASLPDYTAVGYYFGKEDDRKYAYMTFDYKFPTAEGNGHFATYAHTGATSGSPTWLNGKNAWSVGGSGAESTDATATEWTQAKGKNYTNAYSACIGFGRVPESGSEVIYLDNIIVWEFNESVNTTHNSKISATVTFANSTGNESNVTMPEPYTGIAWCNLYGAQGSNCTVNLNNYVPTGAPEGKRFIGWSLTDGGNVIKSTMYHEFKIPGSITLYAVWQKIDTIVKKEDFEGFAENQILTGADLAFIDLNNFGVDTFVATVKKDAVTGNKYLRIDTIRWGGIQVKNRIKESGTEYWKLNYRYPDATGSRFVVYTGSAHTGSNQGSGFVRKTEWTNALQSSDMSKAVLGAFFDNANGNYSIEIDDMYYWFVPDEATTKVVTTFANSTQNAPENPILPDAIVKNVWTYPETSNNSISLSGVTASDPDGVYRFVGWSRTDGGKVINLYESNYASICNETLYAIWECLTYEATEDCVTVLGTLDLTGLSENATIYLCSYEIMDGKQSLVGIKELAGYKREVNFICEEIEIAKIPDAVKLLVWNNIQGMKPMTVSMNINGGFVTVVDIDGIYAEDGQKIEDPECLSASEAIAVKLSYDNRKSPEKSFICKLELYDANGTMFTEYRETMVCQENAVSETQVSFTMPEHIGKVSGMKVVVSDPAMKNPVSEEYFICDDDWSPMGTLSDTSAGNLVTTFGDSETVRQFAWTAEKEHTDMVIRYVREEDGWDETEIIDATYVEYEGRLHYKASIDNLLPGESYAYKIGDMEDGIWSEVYTFTMAPETPQEFSFLGVTDPQSSSWTSGFEYYKEILDVAFTDDSGIDFMVNLGDMVEEGYKYAQWDYYFDAVKGIAESIPHMAVVGNHETRGNENTSVKYYTLMFNNPQNGKGAFGALTPDHVGENGKGVVNNQEGTVYSFDYGDAHFVVLNSGTDYSEEDAVTILTEQAKWLRNDLKASDKKWKIVMIHQGMYPAKTERFSTRKPLLSVIDECGVDLVLQGHDHMVARTYPMYNDAIVTKENVDVVTKGSGTVYTILGAAGPKRYDELTSIPNYFAMLEATQSKQPTYSLFTVNSEKISVVTKQLDGTVVDSYEISTK